MGFSTKNIYSIGKVPINAPFRQQKTLLLFRLFTPKKKYDHYIIAGDWAMAGAVRNKPNTWYVHSPIREIWDLYPHTRKHLVVWWKKLPFDIWVLLNRYLNKKYTKHVGQLVCNSKNTQQRVKKFLGRDATIIHPPIETQEYTWKKDKGYWLSVNRLIAHKRVTMQLAAFKHLPKEKLVIVGSYEQAKHFLAYKKKIKRLQPNNVTIKEFVDEKELHELYAHCKGFITTAKDEDFGMTVVEAMASGKPVIAPNEGGYKESITPKTGILIDDITPKKIVTAVQAINKKHNTYKKACQQQAKKFNTKVITKQLITNIYKVKK
jgi:glycosyltransferase involved in cell wall biosynthesis